MPAYLHAIAVALPEGVQSNAELTAGVEGWSAEKIEQKTGIRQRRVAGPQETAADLATAAAERLFAETALPRSDIDGLIFVTQSPDYPLPTTACLLQDRLQLPRTCAAFDVNLGCSGFTYGLWLARSLILSQSRRNVLLLMGETYSKYCNPGDIATASLFGDGATACVVSGEATGAWAEIGPSVLGTDGRGAENLILRTGGSRRPAPQADTGDFLFMNGAEITSFAVGTVRPAILDLLKETGRSWDQIDRFVFHQANPAFVERLARAYRIPPEKVLIELADVGNTCCATIPMVIERSVARGAFAAGQTVVLVGFGVGYSWAATLLDWKRNA